MPRLFRRFSPDTPRSRSPRYRPRPHFRSLPLKDLPPSPRPGPNKLRPIFHISVVLFLRPSPSLSLSFSLPPRPLFVLPLSLSLSLFVDSSGSLLFPGHRCRVTYYDTRRVERTCELKPLLGGYGGPGGLPSIKFYGRSCQYTDPLLTSRKSGP